MTKLYGYIGAGAAILAYFLYINMQLAQAETTIAEKDNLLLIATHNQAVLQDALQSEIKINVEKQLLHEKSLALLNNLKVESNKQQAKINNLNKSIRNLAKVEGENRDWLTEKIPDDITSIIANGLRAERDNTLQDYNGI